MNTLLMLVDLAAILVILLTGAVYLYETNPWCRRWSSTPLWIAVLMIAVGTAYDLTTLGSNTVWQMFMHIGFAIGCVVKAPGPWLGWVRDGKTAPAMERKALL